MRRWEILLVLIGLILGLGAVSRGSDPSRVTTTSSTMSTPSTMAPTTTTEPPTTTTTSDPDPVYPSIGYWDAIHACEQPDSWMIQGRFGNGLLGGGGLGISDGAWNENGGQQYAPQPGQASPLDQMRVAGHILRRYGPGAWGCKA